MGATTSTFNSKYQSGIAIINNIFDAFKTLNVKSWSGTDQEEFEIDASQTAFAALADIANDSTSKTSNTDVATAASVNTMFTAIEQLEAPVLSAIEALNMKDWELADSRIAIVETAISTLNTALDAFDAAAAVTTTVGADKTDAAVLFSSRMGGVTDMIVPILMARRNKRYTEADRLIEVSEPGLQAALSATARNRT